LVPARAVASGSRRRDRQIWHHRDRNRFNDEAGNCKEGPVIWCATTAAGTRRRQAHHRRQGADVVLDPVGGEVFENSMRCINWGGGCW
jgi:hypothetical protein